MYMYLLQSEPLGTVNPKTRKVPNYLFNLSKKLRSNILFSHILIRIYVLVGFRGDNMCSKD